MDCVNIYVCSILLCIIRFLTCRDYLFVHTSPWLRSISHPIPSFISSCISLLSMCVCVYSSSSFLYWQPRTLPAASSSIQSVHSMLFLLSEAFLKRRRKKKSPLYNRRRQTWRHWSVQYSTCYEGAVLRVTNYFPPPCFSVLNFFLSIFFMWIRGTLFQYYRFYLCRR